MKIFLFGANGMLGYYLNIYLGSKYDVVPVVRNDLDLASSPKLEISKFLDKNISSKDIIINAAGIIKQKEYNVLDMVLVNSVFPQILAEFKVKSGCRVIHITTDCVFDGEKGNYTEKDLHNCVDEYGKTKSLGENPNLTNIRTSIIGEEKNSKKSLLEWIISNKGEEVDGYNNHLWNGVTCLELAKIIERMINEDKFWTGVRHIFSPDTLSKYEILNIVNDIYDLNMKINKKDTDIHCYRNLSTIYDNKMVVKTIYDQILEMKEFGGKYFK